MEFFSKKRCLFGLAKKICAVPEVAESMMALDSWEIFLSVDIMAPGFLVSFTPSASAMYSLERLAID